MYVCRSQISVATKRPLQYMAPLFSADNQTAGVIYLELPNAFCVCNKCPPIIICPRRGREDISPTSAYMKYSSAKQNDYYIIQGGVKNNGLFLEVCNSLSACILTYQTV